MKVQTLKAKYKSATIDEFIEQYAGDISRGGIFIKTPKPAPNGTLLKVEIQLRDAQPVISAVGRVVWRREAPVGREPAGMGIKFIKVDEESQAIIERIASSRPEGEGPRFDEQPTGTAEEALAKPAGATQSDFFGATNPEAEMPAAQDRTMMRQMSAFLGEALRSTSEGGEPAAEAAKPAVEATRDVAAAPPAKRTGGPPIKQTIVGMPAIQNRSAPSGTVVTAAVPPAPTPSAAATGGTVVTAAAPPAVATPGDVGASSGTVLTGAAPPPVAKGPVKSSTMVGMPSVRPPSGLGESANEEEPTRVTGRDKLDALMKEAEKPSVPPPPADKPVASEVPAATTAAAVAAAVALEAEAAKPEPAKPAVVEPVAVEPAAKKPEAIEAKKPEVVEAKKPVVVDAVKAEPKRPAASADAARPAAKKPEAAVPARTAARSEPPPAEKKSGIGTGTIAAVAAALVLGVVGVWYFNYRNAGDTTGGATGNDTVADAGSNAVTDNSADAHAAATAPDVAAPVAPDAAVAVVPPTPPTPVATTATLHLTGLRPGAQVYVGEAEQPVGSDGTLSVPAGHPVELRVHSAGFADQRLTTNPTAGHTTTVAVHQNPLPAPAGGATGVVAHPHPVPTGTGTTTTHVTTSPTTNPSTGTATTTTTTTTHATEPTGGESGSTAPSGGSGETGTAAPHPHPTHSGTGSTGTGSTGTGSTGTTAAPSGSGASPDNPY